MQSTKRAFAALALVGVLPAASAARIQAAPRRACQRTYATWMVDRAIRAIYRGTRDVSAQDRANLARYVRCMRDPAARLGVERYRRRMVAAWRARRHPSCSWQLASWYTDGGATASGWHAAYGVANKWLPFGTRVHFSYGGRSVWAVVDDRGPYVGGRVWDLSQSTAGALGFGGVGSVCASVSG